MTTGQQQQAAMNVLGSLLQQQQSQIPLASNAGITPAQVQQVAPGVSAQMQQQQALNQQVSIWATEPLAFGFNTQKTVGWRLGFVENLILLSLVH